MNETTILLVLLVLVLVKEVVVMVVEILIMTLMRTLRKIWQKNDTVCYYYQAQVPMEMPLELVRFLSSQPDWVTETAGGVSNSDIE